MILIIILFINFLLLILEIFKFLISFCFFRELLILFAHISKLFPQFKSFFIISILYHFKYELNLYDFAIINYFWNIYYIINNKILHSNLVYWGINLFMFVVWSYFKFQYYFFNLFQYWFNCISQFLIFILLFFTLNFKKFIYLEFVLYLFIRCILIKFEWFI